MSDYVRPHRRSPTRPPHPWDFQGKNTGVGCHFLLQCMKVKSESEVAQSFPTPSDPMDCSPPGSSVHGFSRQEYWSGVPLPSPSLSLCSFKIYKYLVKNTTDLDSPHHEVHEKEGDKTIQHCTLDFVLHSYLIGLGSHSYRVWTMESNH